MTEQTTDGDVKAAMVYDSDGSVKEDAAVVRDVLANTVERDQEYREADEALSRLATRLSEQEAELERLREALKKAAALLDHAGLLGAAAAIRVELAGKTEEVLAALTPSPKTQEGEPA